jgi:hypothetical protein
MKRQFAVSAAIVVAMVAQVWGAGLEQVSPREAIQWVRWVIPQPHHILIRAQKTVRSSEVFVRIAPQASPLERSAASELSGLWRAKTGLPAPVVTAKQPARALEIVLGVCDAKGRFDGCTQPVAARLFTLKNAEQAYRIVPLDDRTLALIGTRPQGVYYAAKTLQQLLGRGFSQPGAVQVPWAEVTDWPDLAERGLWGGSANADLEWMAARKMNLVETHVDLSVDAAGRGTAQIAPALLARARSHAVKLVPIITHLEQLPAVVFERFPELRAVGDPQAWRRIGAVSPVCFSQPKAQQLVTDWMTALARYADVTDICLWLSENNVPCGCEKCKGVNPFVLQTRLALRAWEAAKQVRPDVRLRILLTQGSYPSNEQVLATVPPAVGITYYDGGRTYDSSRDPMIYPLLEKFAADGRWLGCYPQLTASWRVVCPWSAPQFIKARMAEFVDKRLACLCGYATPSNRFYEFNVIAAAEWSWNAKGRMEQEFAAAWATQAGLADPDRAARWAIMLGPVGWDVYGSRVPYYWVHANLSSWVKPGRHPKLGAGIFRYFPQPEQFATDLAACNRAMELAQALRAPALIEETRVIRGLVTMLQGFYEMGEALAAGAKTTETQRLQAAVALALADRGAREASAGMRAWGEAVAPELTSTSSRYGDTVRAIERIMTQASDLAATAGVDDPERPYRERPLGTWVTEDFASGPRQTKTWDATRLITGPGRYRIVFHYDSGWHGTRIREARLVQTEPAQPEPLDRDVHDGSTGHRPRNTTYELLLQHYDPKASYFVEADLIGPPRNETPERSACAGHVTFCRLKD